MSKSSQSDRRSIKVNLTCPCCLRICKNPVTLPCQDNLCEEHLHDFKFLKDNHIKCLVCKKEFNVKNNQFPSNNMLQKLIDNENYLNSDEKSSKMSLRKSLEEFHELCEEPNFSPFAFLCGLWRQ